MTKVKKVFTEEEVKKMIADITAQKDKEIAEAKKRKATGFIMVSTDKNSIQHINTFESLCNAALENEDFKNDFILSADKEENVTSNKLNCVVVRTKLEIREFYKNAMLEATINYKKS